MFGKPREKILFDSLWFLKKPPRLGFLQERRCSRVRLRGGGAVTNNIGRQPKKRCSNRACARAPLPAVSLGTPNPREANHRDHALLRCVARDIERPPQLSGNCRLAPG